jgi:DNA-binding NarL/FixJ family response regulator
VGLVDVRPASDGEPEFRLLETIRAIAAADLREAGVAAEYERRHAEWYADRAVAAADAVRTSSYSEQRGGSALADPNLVVALERAIAFGDGDVAVQLAASLATRAMQTGMLSEAAVRLDAALALPLVEPGIRADGLNAILSVRGALGAVVDLADAREAVELATRSGSGIRVVRTLITLGNWSNVGRAIHYAKAAALAEEIGYGWGAAVAWSSLSDVWWDEGRHADAFDASTRAERAHQERGDLTGVALEVMTRGTYALALGDIAGALDALTRAVDAFAVHPGIPMFETNALSALATAQALAGKTSDAYGTLVRAAERASVAESPYEVLSWLEAAAVVLEQGHPALAARCLGAIDRAVSEDRLGAINEPVRAALSGRLERRIGRHQLVRERAAGRARSPGELLQHLLPRIRREAGPPEGGISGPFGALTMRENEILRLLADGRTDRQIGADLGISPKTASVHVANLKSKLGVETRVAAVIAARERLGSSAY